MTTTVHESFCDKEPDYDFLSDGIGTDSNSGTCCGNVP